MPTTYNQTVLERLKLKRARENGTESFALMHKIQEGRQDAKETKEKLDFVSSELQEIKDRFNENKQAIAQSKETVSQKEAENLDLSERFEKSMAEIEELKKGIGQSESLLSYVSEVDKQNRENSKTLKGLEKRMQETDNKDVEIVIE